MINVAIRSQRSSFFQMYQSPRALLCLICTSDLERNQYFYCCDSLKEKNVKCEVASETDQKHWRRCGQKGQEHKQRGNTSGNLYLDVLVDLHNSPVSAPLSHTHQLTADSWLPVSVYVTWRKECVSGWSGATWSWNWCCWSSSVPSDHGSLPRNDCTLHTQEEIYQPWQPLKDRNDCDECASDECTGKTDTCIHTIAQTQVKGIIIPLAHHNNKIFNLHYVFNCQNLLLKHLFFNQLS